MRGREQQLVAEHPEVERIFVLSDVEGFTSATKRVPAGVPSVRQITTPRSFVTVNIT